MASPQTENGYTKIANELLDALCCLHISGNEWSYVHALIRKTYGYNKKEDWVTNTQIAALTGMNKVRVSEAKTKLLELQIVTENRNKISLQKDYTKWGKLRKTVTKVTENRNSELRKTVSTKDNIQKTKEIGDKSPDSDPLVVNKKDMPWNQQSDDYEEGVVDFDGDGTTKGEKKPQTKKYPNAQKVYKVFFAVLGKLPANWKLNRTQLQAAENLYTERSLKAVENALKYYKANKDVEFCPQVATPYDLDTKWSKLGEFKKKHGT
jgi:phage replication O-like protein O